MTDNARVRLQLPYHLQTLAQCGAEVEVDVSGTGTSASDNADDPAVTVHAVIRALEARYPMLRGAIIDHYTGQRRPKVRFFACGEDYSLKPLDTSLPAAVLTGDEPLIVIGAISGG